MTITTIDINGELWKEFDAKIQKTEKYDSRTDFLRKKVREFTHNKEIHEKEPLKAERERLKSEIENSKEDLEKKKEVIDGKKNKLETVENKLEKIQSKEEKKRRKRLELELKELKNTRDMLEGKLEHYRGLAENMRDKDGSNIETDSDVEEYAKEKVEKKHESIFEDVDVDDRSELKDRITEIKEELQ
jgi:chromosome segregation ATPase